QYSNKKEMDRIVLAADKLSRTKMFIDDTPALSILELRARCRRLHQREGGLDLVIIDYLQLLRGSSAAASEHREREVAEISSGIKSLAKELKVPILSLAQLNRDPEKRTTTGRSKPRLSDIRESGSIEQDADVVALLWREDYQAHDAEDRKEIEESAGKTELIIAKQRNGPTGEVPLVFLKEFTRFEERALKAGD
ncbi:MAG: DnaB-like helicase C-terminal domain-containing protein, partial [Terrimicrobiaceae bacterium]|nr:DnaB-like helicase C-terminal domain-containing protein [Terrimicrobiaceae bacterium]